VLGGWLKVTCRLTACTPVSSLGPFRPNARKRVWKKNFTFTFTLSKSNPKDHYGDGAKKTMSAVAAEINEFSAFDDML